MQKLSIKYLAGLGLYALGVNMVWISYSSILLPLQIQSVVPPEGKALALGLVAGMAIAVGVLVNLVAGVVSDHSTSAWGRRRPVMLGGALLTLPCILVMTVFPESLPMVMLSYLGIQIFTNFSSGAYQPVLADVVPENQRGMGAGFQGFFNLTGSALGFGLITALVGWGKFPTALVLLGGVFLLTTLVSCYIIRAHDKPLEGAASIPVYQAFLEIFRPRVKVVGFFWFVGGCFFVFMGVSGFQFFGLYYYQSVLKVSDPLRALQITGLLNLLVSMIAAVIAGIISDRLSRRKMILVGALAAGGLSLFFPFLRSFPIFLLIAALYAATIGTILSVSMALASSLAPVEEAGKYMAYNNLASGSAGAIAPPLFGAALSARGAPDATSFLIFFAMMAFFYLVSSVVFWRMVPER